MTVEIPTWMLSTIFAGVVALVLFVVRSFFQQAQQQKWQAEVDANQKKTAEWQAKMDTKFEVLIERFGTVKAQVDGVEKRSDAQASAHNSAMQSLREEFRRKP